MTYVQYVNEGPEHVLLTWGGNLFVFPKKGNKTGLEVKTRTDEEIKALPSPVGAVLHYINENKELPPPNPVVSVPIELVSELTSGNMRRAGSAFLKPLEKLHTQTLDEVERLQKEAAKHEATILSQQGEMASLIKQLEAAKAELDSSKKVK